MTNQEAIDLENKCDKLMSEALGEECTVSMALTGRLKVNFDENYFSLNKELTDASYIKYHGYYESLVANIYKACECISYNKELYDKLMWSYEHKSELKD